MNKNIYSVSQVNTYIERMFADDFMLGNLSLSGEVSNCKYNHTGHIYFTLKDEKSAISCVMFAGKRAKGLGGPGDARLQGGRARLRRDLRRQRDHAGAGALPARQRARRDRAGPRRRRAAGHPVPHGQHRGRARHRRRGARRDQGARAGGEPPQIRGGYLA